MITNIKSLGLLRNGKVYQTKQLARQALTQQNPTNDGVAKLARYLELVDGEEVIRTLVGFYANAAEMEDAGGGKSSYTILDVDGSAGDVTQLWEAVDAINEKIGDGIDGTTLTIAINDINERLGSGFTSANTVADHLAELEYSMTLHMTRSEDEDSFIYTLTQGDTEVGEINIAKDIFIQYAEVVRGTWSGDTFTEDPDGPDKAIKLVFQDELHSPIYINIADLIDLYVGGNGIEINDDTISIKLDSDSEAFLTVGENGLELSGVQDAINEAIEKANLQESDGIKILDNNKIKAHAASFSDNGIVNPVFVDAEGIKLNSVLDMGFYDYSTVVNDTTSVTDPSTTNIVMTTTSGAQSLTSNTEYNSVTIAGAALESGDVKAAANHYVAIDNVELSGSKGASNGRVLISASTVSITNVDVPNGTTAYNIFEGSQTTANTKYFTKEYVASNVNVDDPSLKHNVFNIYTLENDAVVTIKDSYFNLNVNNTNVIRLANYTNATGVTINFENVSWTYENADTSDPTWAGLLIFQPAATDAALVGDTSKIATWTVNVKDCVYNGVKVNSNNFGNINQVAILYNVNGSGAVTDASSTFTINFE